MGEAWLVTGGNRGLGFGVVEKLSHREGTVIFATARDPSKASALTKLASSSKAKIHIVKMVAASETDAAEVAKHVEATTGGLDYVIFNAGIADYYGPIATTPIEQFRNHYEVNTIGPIVLFQSLYPLLLKRNTRKILLTSSLVGSLRQPPPMPCTAYGASKASLNYFGVKLNMELKDEGFVVVVLSPGWVATEMGNAGANAMGSARAPVEVDDSVTGQIKVIEEATTAQSGKFLNYTGEELPY